MRLELKSSVKSARKIVVENREFHWKADWEWIHDKDLRIIKFRAWLGEGRGTALKVNLTGDPLFQGELFIRPKNVAALIKYALGHKWNPDDNVTCF